MATNQEMHSATYVAVATKLDGKISDIPNKVWNTKVTRDGQQISAIQELADAKSLALKLQADVAALTKSVAALTALVQQLLAKH